jgi:hypothetical protein
MTNNSTPHVAIPAFPRAAATNGHAPSPTASPSAAAHGPFLLSASTRALYVRVGAPGRAPRAPWALRAARCLWDWTCAFAGVVFLAAMFYAWLLLAV